MYYFKNFGLLLLVTGFLAACQATDSQAVDDSGNEETVDTNKTKVSEDSNSTEESEEKTSENKNNSTEENNIEQGKVEDEQLAKIIDKSTEIESYKAELNLEASLDEMEEESLNAEADVINGDPPQLRLRSAGEDRTLSRDGQTYFYNGQDWINVSDSVDVNLLYSVTYDQAVHSLETLFGYMTTEETDDKIIYKYHGNDEEVYRNLESLVQVNFGQMTVETVESSIEFIVDEEKMLIEKINFDVEGKDTGGTFSLNGDTTFDNFNNIDQIELPNE